MTSIAPKRIPVVQISLTPEEVLRILSEYAFEKAKETVTLPKDTWFIFNRGALDARLTYNDGFHATIEVSGEPEAVQEAFLP